MLVSELRIGMPLLNGRVYVIHLKRHGAYSDIELTDGKSVKRITLHKSQSIMTALVGTMRSESRDKRLVTRVPASVRASNPVWRGEHARTVLPHSEVRTRQR